VAQAGKYTTTEREQAFLDTIENPKYDRQIINGLLPLMRLGGDPGVQGEPAGSGHVVPVLLILGGRRERLEGEIPPYLSDRFSCSGIASTSSNRSRALNIQRWPRLRKEARS